MKIELNSNFNIKSLSNLCGDSKKISIFGWSHCRYFELPKAIETSQLKQNNKIFDVIKSNLLCKLDVTNPEGEIIENITPNTIDVHKGIETNIVFENCKRKARKLAIIKIIFCIDIDSNQYPCTSETITSRDFVLNQLMTNRELRRCYRLCHELNSEIHEVAKETLTFVKLTQQNGEFVLQQIDPFWKGNDWESMWQKRMDTKVAHPYALYKSDWKKLFIGKLNTWFKENSLKEEG